MLVHGWQCNIRWRNWTRRACSDFTLYEMPMSLNMCLKCHSYRPGRAEKKKGVIYRISLVQNTFYNPQIIIFSRLRRAIMSEISLVTHKSRNFVLVTLEPREPLPPPPPHIPFTHFDDVTQKVRLVTFVAVAIIPPKPHRRALQHIKN